MNCDGYRDAILDVARGVETDGETPARLQEHLERCPACSALLRMEQELTADLRALARAAGRLQASDALEDRLVAAFEDRHPALAGAPGARPWRSVWRIAAAIAVIGTSAWVWRTMSQRPIAGEAKTAQAPSPPAAPRPVIAAVVPDQQAGASGQAAGVRAAAGRNRSSPQIGRIRPTPRVVEPVGFISLPGADRLPEFESGAIVRVELPVASLPSYGVEIAPDTATPVRADLLVGQDGRARAIRLVNIAAEPRSRQ